VKTGWETGPITDVKVVAFEEGGLFGSDTKCPDGYEVGPKVFYAGLVEGCVCTGGKYSSVYYSKCREDALASNMCRDIPEYDSEMLEVAN
jgi:hypothetical protein